MSATPAVRLRSFVEALPISEDIALQALDDIATLDAARAVPDDTLDVERLRVATWRLSNAADALSRYARHADDPGHRSWFPAAIGDVEREVGLARAAAGPAPTTAEYAALSEKP